MCGLCFTGRANSDILRLPLQTQYVMPQSTAPLSPRLGYTGLINIPRSPVQTVQVIQAPVQHTVMHPIKRQEYAPLAEKLGKCC